MVHRIKRVIGINGIPRIQIHTGEAIIPKRPTSKIRAFCESLKTESSLDYSLIFGVMMLEHVAIWTRDLERMKEFYCQAFGGKAGVRYDNPEKKFQSYFLTFESGARLELMRMTGVPENVNDTVVKQHQGIIHLAFGVKTRDEVDTMASQFKSLGYRILSGPRATGDGYYEFEMLDPENNRLEVTSK